MLYTGRGDDGLTQLWGEAKRVSKNSAMIAALGELDEVNSFLGLVKLKAGRKLTRLLDNLQQNLFIIQAEVAGAKKKITPEKLVELEAAIEEVEAKLPPIKTFLVSGGTELAALLDYARALSRRAERQVVGLKGKRQVGETTLAYLNRLSSFLYALARLENQKSGIKEESPRY